MSKKGRTPDDNELSLWQKVVKGVSPWREDAIQTPPPPSAKPIKKHDKSLSSRQSQTHSKPAQQTLDRRTNDKLIKGKMPIEATLDMHGMKQAEAHGALEQFLVRAHAAGKRCVLVITGKGSGQSHDTVIVSERREKGVLKARLPDWLAMMPLASIVLKHTHATQKHGGGGAFYIYLKKNMK